MDLIVGNHHRHFELAREMRPDSCLGCFRMQARFVGKFDNKQLFTLTTLCEDETGWTNTRLGRSLTHGVEQEPQQCSSCQKTHAIFSAIQSDGTKITLKSMC